MKKGFTLAEALTTLGIIGVIAALLMPYVTIEINKKLRQEQKRVAVVKLTKAMELMALKGEIKKGSFFDSQDFVNKLQKYMALPEYCGATGCPNCYLKCWEATKFRYKEDVYDIKKAEKATYFNNIADKNHAYNGYNVSFITSDGVVWLVGWNSLCPTLKPGVYPWSYENGKPITNATTACISGMFDLNGGKGPNVVGDDIHFLNVTSLGNDCPLKLGDQAEGTVNTCLSTAIVPAPLSYSDCMAQKDELGIQNCFDYGSDYWAGAVAACGGIDKVSGISDFGYMADLMYDKDFSGGFEDSTGLKFNENTSRYGLPYPPFTLWTNNELSTNYSEPSADNIYAQTVTFNRDSIVTNSSQKRFDSDTASGFKVLCKRPH